MSCRIKGFVVVTAVAIAVLASWGPSAAAHEDEGVLELVDQSVDEQLRAEIVVRLTHVDDGHLATDATVTLVAESAQTEASIGPVSATLAEPGIYRGAIDLPSPGDWLLRVTSLSPSAYLEQVVMATEPTSTTVAPPTSAPTSTTSVASSDQQASTTDAVEVATTPPATNVRSDRDDDTARQIVFGVVVAVLVVGGALIVWTTRRSRGPS